jgi:hypothetical protein
VYVDGQPYGPGEVSARIAKKIDNPKVWAKDEDEAQEPAPAEPPADEAPPADDEAAPADDSAQADQS